MILRLAGMITSSVSALVTSNGIFSPSKMLLRFFGQLLMKVVQFLLVLVIQLLGLFLGLAILGLGTSRFPSWQKF